MAATTASTIPSYTAAAVPSFVNGAVFCLSRTYLIMSPGPPGVTCLGAVLNKVLMSACDLCHRQSSH